MKKSYNITIAGLGYVGISMAILLSKNNNVIGFDIDDKKIESIRKGVETIKIDDSYNYKEYSGKLLATLDMKKAFSNADFIVIATPTNYDLKINQFDTSAVEDVIKNVTLINPKACIVIRSTVPVGFTEKMIRRYCKEDIIFSPEFLRELKALQDNLYPDRIVIGATESMSKKACIFTELLKEAAIRKDVKVMQMSTSEAEAVKLFSNSYLALRVAYFNELDTFAEEKSLNSSNIIKGVCLDHRIGDYYNNPSFGYGGYCLPKDVQQLLSDFETVPEMLISAIINSNNKRKNFIANKIFKKMVSRNSDGELNKSVIGIYRINMKTNSDNLRFSSVQEIIDNLAARGVTIVIYEPIISNNNLSTYKGYQVISSFEKFVKQSDIIVANRYNDELDTVKEKVYTRDIFYRD